MDEIKRNCTNSWEMAREWFVYDGPRLLETERMAGGADHACPLVSALLLSWILFTISS